MRRQAQTGWFVHDQTHSCFGSRQCHLSSFQEGEVLDQHHPGASRHPASSEEGCLDLTYSHSGPSLVQET